MVSRAASKLKKAFDVSDVTRQGYNDLIFLLEQLDKIEHAQDYDKIKELQQKYGTRTW